MNIWEMLGIAPTKDVTAIKKAYAARAKECHPEEHPEEYQRLRAAYKRAVQYAKQESVPVIYHELPLSEEEPRKTRPQPTDPAPAPEPEPVSFLFEEVDRYLLPRKVEQFYLEFEYISWNPYLINNPLVWKCLCGRPVGQELLADESFRMGLAERICKLPMLRREAFEFWDSLFAGYGDEVRLREEWRRKRHICALESLFHRAEHMVTHKERNMHAKMLERMSDHNMNNRLKSMSSVENYLAYYLPYAGRYHREMEKQYRSGRRARIVWSAIGTFSVVMLTTVVAVNVYQYRRENAEAEVPEEWTEEIQTYDDRIYDEERIQQRDAVWKDMLETYGSWLEEEKSTEGY